MLLALLSFGATACHKTCVCTAFNGVEHTYTAEEVEERGGNCSNLIMQANTRLYSYCRWD